VGSRPGTLVVGPDAAPTRVEVIRYDLDHVIRAAIDDVAALGPLVEAGGVVWIDVNGFRDEATLRALGDRFAIHALALEDVVNVPQRPKVEDYPGHLLLITRMARLADDGQLDLEQVGLLVGPSWVISFQERHGDVLEPVRRRVADGNGPIRGAGPSYLAYAIVDTIVDGYYPVIESISAKLEKLELELGERPGPSMVRRLNKAKTQLVLLRRGLAPQQEALLRVTREGSTLFPEEVRLHLRDTLDHCAQLVEVIDSHRELINSMMSTYLSVISHRSGEVMKVLTIAASIFIPLTFLAGVYGMNFSEMPGASSHWGFIAMLVTMLVVAIGMIAFFHHKGWIGGGGDGDDD
jgi:magnesium transporter